MEKEGRRLRGGKCLERAVDEVYLGVGDAGWASLDSRERHEPQESPMAMMVAREVRRDAVEPSADKALIHGLRADRTYECLLHEFRCHLSVTDDLREEACKASRVLAIERGPIGAHGGGTLVHLGGFHQFVMTYNAWATEKGAVVRD